MKKIRVILFFTLIVLYSNAQTKRIERLKQEIHQAGTDDARLKAILAYCDEWESLNPDTLKKYTELARPLAAKEGGIKEKLLVDFYAAAYLLQVNKLDSGLSAVTSVLNNYKKSFPYDENWVKMYVLKGNLLNRTVKLNELMEQNLELIKLAEEHQDTLALARATIGVGNVQSKLKKYDEALTWYHKAFSLMKNPVYRQKLSFAYNNTGIVFFHLQQKDSALHYVELGIGYAKGGGSLTDLSNSLFLKGGLLSEYGEPQKAENSFKEAIEIRKQTGDIYFLVADMGQLAFFYANTGQPQKGIALCKEAISLAEKHGPMYSNMSSLYEVLGKNYKAAGDFKNYSESLIKLLELKDSVYKINSAEEIAALQTKFEVQKKEATIASQQLKLLRRNVLVTGSALLLLIAAFAGWLLFRRYRLKQKQKLQKVLEEERIQKEVAIKETEEKERKRIAADLHDNIGVQANSILYNTELMKLEGAINEEMIDSLHDTAKSMLLNLRETLWAMKTSDVTAADIWLRVISFIKQMGRNYTKINFITKGTAPDDIIIPSAKALHIIMIVQEAVNNAVKHARASEIVVSSVNVYPQWQISVNDNGHGFNMQEAISKKDSHGLSNMKERASLAGIKLHIETARGTGTTLSISV